jgi:hypothetical protein
VVLSGITGAHGIASAVETATLDHGQAINPLIHIFPVRPDHRGPGHYVREHRQPGDVVITEHPSTQFIYAGQVDYWLRRPGDARRFLYLASDGVPRDIYANTILLPTVERIEQVVRSAGGRVWLITSGETHAQEDWYLSPHQRAWLDSLETSTEPEFLGQDGISGVFCLNCTDED